MRVKRIKTVAIIAGGGTLLMTLFMTIMIMMAIWWGQAPTLGSTCLYVCFEVLSDIYLATSSQREADVGGKGCANYNQSDKQDVQ